MQLTLKFIKRLSEILIQLEGLWNLYFYLQTSNPIIQPIVIVNQNKSESNNFHKINWTLIIFDQNRKKSKLLH